MDKDKVQKLKFIIAIFIIVLVIAFVAFRIIKYQTEGEKNMPFNLSKIIVVSTAQKEDITQENGQNNLWNINIIQTNDVYISIERNKKNTKTKEILSYEKIYNQNKSRFVGNNQYSRYCNSDSNRNSITD